MAYDPSKVYFITESTVDKILDENVYSHVEGAGSPSALSTSVQTQANLLGVSVWVEGQYSIDATNYYPLGVPVLGAVSGTGRQSVFCYAYADASNIHFYFENGFTSSKTFNIRYAMEALS